MTRRVVLAILALVAAVLGAIAVPLGVITASQAMRDFRAEARVSASTVANVAEERLDDGVTGPALGRSIAGQTRTGDVVSVFTSDGRLVAGSPLPAPVTMAQVRRAMTTNRTATVRADDWYVVVRPVQSDSGRASVGAVVLARPTAAVDHRVAELWVIVGAVAAAGLVAAALVAVGLAQWISRPLRRLESAARAFGDGDLATRSPDATGPAEVRSLAANFNQMAGRLEALVRGSQATMADVSHQLRTPLAALRLRLDVLAVDSDAETATELAGAQDEIARLSRLVDGLLAVARAENIDAPQRLVAADEVVWARVAAWQPAADERSVRLRADLQPAEVRMGDGQLEQILDNLIANALDALPEGGTIRLSSVVIGDHARVAVADDGSGMSAGQQRTAFRRFATGSASGTGLGLAIVDRLAVSNGGSAALSDSPGGGLTVTIELPVARRQRSGRRAGPSHGQPR